MTDLKHLSFLDTINEQIYIQRINDNHDPAKALGDKLYFAGLIADMAYFKINPQGAAWSLKIRLKNLLYDSQDKELIRLIKQTIAYLESSYF